MVAKRLLNILSQRSSIRSKTRRQRLTRNNYKTLRQLEKKGVLYQQAPLAQQLLKLAEIQENDPDYKELLNKRTRLGKFFDYFYSKPYHSERTIPQILDKDLGTLKRFTQKIKNTLRRKPYSKALKTRKNIMTRLALLNQKRGKKAPTATTPLIPKSVASALVTKPSTPKILSTPPKSLNPPTQQAYGLLSTLIPVASVSNKIFPYVNIKHYSNSCYIATALQFLYRIPHFRNGIQNVNLQSADIQKYLYSNVNIPVQQRMNADIGSFVFPKDIKGEPIVALQGIFKTMEDAENIQQAQVDVEKYWNNNFTCLPETWMNETLKIRKQKDINDFLTECIFGRLQTPGTKGLILPFYFKLATNLAGLYDNKNIPDGDIVSKNVTLIEYKSQQYPQYKVKVKDPPKQEISTSLQLPFGNLADNAKGELQNLIDHNSSYIDQSLDDLYIPLEIQVGQQQIKPRIYKKQLYPIIPPDLRYLYVHLVRNKFDKGVASKHNQDIYLNKYIKIEHTTTPNRHAYFELEGIACHQGTTVTSGHYIYVWHDSVADRWIEIDDMKSTANYLTLKNGPFVSFTTLPVEIQSYILLFKRLPQMTDTEYANYRQTVSLNGITLLPIGTI